MDVRNRRAVTLKTDRENIPTCPNKGHATLKDVRPQRRPALGEIGNKVAAQQNATKPLPFQEVKKKTVVTKPTTNKVTNITKERLLKKEVKPVIKIQKKIGPPTAPKPESQSYSSSRLNGHDIKDIDKDDLHDPLLLGVYANDIYTYLREMEVKLPVRQNYLTAHKVTGKMRAMLVDWLVDVHLQFQMLQETLYLTVANIDRFMQGAMDIHRKKFQLVGIAAMFLACKYEEMYSPEIADFIYIADKAYTKEEILDMTARIAKALDFSFGRPLAPHFLRRYSKAAQASPRQHIMAKYLMELCLVEYEMCHIAPSQIAAAAIYLVLRLSSNRGKEVWTDTLVHYSQYTPADITSVVRKMANVVLQAEDSNFQAVRKKYASSKLMKISTAPELKSVPLQNLARS